MGQTPTEFVHQSELNTFKRLLVLITCGAACLAYFFLPLSTEIQPWLATFHALSNRVMAATSLCFFIIALLLPSRFQLFAQSYFVANAFYFTITLDFVLLNAPAEKDAISLGLMPIAPFVALPIIWAFAFFDTRRAVWNSIFYTVSLSLALCFFYLISKNKPSPLVINALNQLFILANILTIACMVVFSKMTDAVISQQQKQEVLQSVALTDTLTQLHNRRFMQRVLQNEILRFQRYKGIFFVVIIDLDHFKKINDTHGHDIGDRALKAAAEVFKNNFQQRDLVGRWGGEEFLAILPDTNEIEALALLNRVRVALENYKENGVPPITASFGLSWSRPGTTDVNQIVSEADKALYRAKANGRNRVEIFKV
jgi:diguanylate cyclase (GGDEF)-like protein